MTDQENLYPWELNEMCSCGHTFAMHGATRPYRGLKSDCDGFEAIDRIRESLDCFWRELNA